MHIHSSSVRAPQHPATELEQLGDEIAELSAHLDAATARLLELIRAFDARGGWNTGFCSCAAWLSWRVGLDLGAARERVRVARALGTLPLLADALARGELSSSKVRALTRVAPPAAAARLPTVAPAPRGSATKWWSTSTPRSWPTRSSGASRSSKAAHTSPRKRPSAWRATPAGWSCATTARAACWRSGPGPGRFLLRYAVPSTIWTKAAASRGADWASPPGNTPHTGPRGAR